MASGVNDANLAEGFFKVTVNSWGTGDNDCLWNIAKGVLERQGIENPTVEEINETIEAIKENNDKIDGYHIREDDIIYKGQEVLVPLEDAIAGIEEKVDTLTSQYNTKKSELNQLNQALLGMNLNVHFKEQAFTAAKDALEDKESTVPESERKSNYEKAKKEYETALNSLEKHKEKIDKKENEVKTTFDEIESFKEDLSECIKEYNSTSDEMDKELGELSGYITEIDGENGELSNKLDALYEELDKFTSEASQESSDEQDAYKQAEEYISDGIKNGIIDSDGNTSKVKSSNSSSANDDKNNVETESGSAESKYGKVTKTSEISQEFWDDISDDKYSSDYLTDLIDQFNSLESKQTDTSDQKAKAEADRMKIYEKMLEYKNNIDMVKKIDDAMKNPNSVSEPIKFGEIEIDSKALEVLSTRYNWGMYENLTEYIKADEYSYLHSTLELACELSETDKKLEKLYDEFSNVQFSSIVQKDPNYNYIINKIIEYHNSGGVSVQSNTNEVLARVAIEEAYEFIKQAEALLEKGTPINK